MTGVRADLPWWGLESIATAHPDAVWAHGASEVTYAQLQHEIDAVRAVLRDQGAGDGSMVAVQLPPSLTMLWWLFALWSERAQVLLLDTRMKPAEARAVLDQVRPSHQATSTALVDPLTGFADEIDVAFDRIGDDVQREADVALVQCSSGTTGQPKIVTRTGRSLLADVDRHARNPGMPTRGERVFLLASLTHSFGLAAGVLHSLRVGASLVFPGQLHPDKLLHRARHTDVHAIFGVPVHFDLLGQATGGDRLTSLRLAISCGDTLPVEVKERFVQRYGVPIGQGYGMTEVGAVAMDLHGDLLAPAVGTVLPGVDVRVVDGELFIKSEDNPYLYADDSDRFSDGWLRTFDRAEVDPGSGVLSLFGRADSVCIIGGLKVDLTEVETIVRGHPRVRDAMALYRAADPGAHDRPPFLEAHVSASGALTAKEITSWCRDRLSDFKIPRVWHIGTDLPRTTSGKVDRGVPR